MKTMFYFGFGILTHLIFWGGEFYGLYSFALLVFWPFFLMWQLILLGVFYVVPVVIILLAGAYIWDRLNGRHPRIW